MLSQCLNYRYQIKEIKDQNPLLVDCVRSFAMSFGNAKECYIYKNSAADHSPSVTNWIGGQSNNKGGVKAP